MALVGGRVLLPDGSFAETALSFGPDGIERVGEPIGAARACPVRGLLVLPGLVDLHGDAFERQLMPRPRVRFDHRIALRDTDRQLVGNGITTAFHALTYSWEPGLRGREAASALLDALDDLRPSLACDSHIHLRFETFNLDAVDEIAGWLGAGRIRLLAFNDHVESIQRDCATEKGTTPYADRSGMSVAEFRALLERVMARAEAVPAAVAALAAAARRAGVPMASHDDETPAMRAAYQALGVALCEFPFDRATAEEARRQGGAIVMGAPNVVRGGSHTRWLSAREAIGIGLCDVLASDYYYPAMVAAAFRLAREGVVDLGTAWRALSTAPAAAAGFADRGRLAAGLRADLVLIDDGRPADPRIAATIVNGRIVHLADASLAEAVLTPLALA
jgi:alpha-D-ribose 1-methylphosphonate 5-triphosphate diphosphatase